MADRWAVATGNWSSTATWNGGTLPTAADDVYADGFTVTIDQNVTVLSIRTTQRTGGTAGGGFTLDIGFNVTANVISGSTVCLTISNASGTNIVTGNVTAGTQGGSNGAINKSGAGTLNIIGNITGGSNSLCSGLNSSGGIVNITGNCIAGSGSQSFGARITGAISINIVGDCIGGGNSGSNGLNWQAATGSVVVTGNATGGSGGTAMGIACAGSSGGTITVNGNVSGHSISANGFGIALEQSTSNVAIVVNGNVSASAASGISSTTANSGTITINGNVTAASNAIGVVQTSTSGWIVINGNAFSASTGVVAFYGQRVLINSTGTLQHEYRVGTAGSPSVARSLYTGGVNLNQPAVTNVRSGTVYGASNEFTGTLIVPSAQFVSLGTPVDSGVGTLQYLTMADLQAALAPNAPVIAERSDDDTKALTFSWPVSGVPVSGFKSFDNGAYSSVSGAISYLRTEGARHYYTLAYNAADRSTQESLIRYRMQDGTYTKYFNLRIMPATNSEVIAIKAKTDNLPADPASSSQITSLLNNAPMEAF